VLKSMNKNQKRNKRLLVEAWLQASKEMNIRVIAPYVVQDSSIEHSFVAYLPDFGNENGMIIDIMDPEDYSSLPELKEVAKNKNLYYSAINPEEYKNFNEEIFHEALIDWGYFGDKERRPSWLDL